MRCNLFTVMQQHTTTIVGGRPAPPVDLIRGASLFLDFDGTLVELAAKPDAVVVEHSLVEVLDDLNEALFGRLAIVTGRSLAEAESLLSPARLALSGSHGAEAAWPDGRRRQADRPTWLDPTISRLEAFSRDRPGVLVEIKPLGAALHYRQAPEAERACLRFAESLAETAHIHVLKGKMVVELRAPGWDKGVAIETFMGDRCMAGSTPIMFGDDVTDEAAFAKASQLGGAGVLVGKDRPTAARYRLDGVPEVRAWLEAALRIAG